MRRQCFTLSAFIARDSKERWQVLTIVKDRQENVYIVLTRDHRRLEVVGRKKVKTKGKLYTGAWMDVKQNVVKWSVERMMGSVVVSEGLTLMYAHVLPEVVVPTEILPASLDRTLVRCNRVRIATTNRNETRYSRFSLVWMDRTCRFKCSPRAKHL